MAYQVQCTHFEGETKESGIAVYKKCQKVKLEKRPQSSRGKVRACCPGLSRGFPGGVRLFATPWTVAHQAPLSMGFSRREYWSGLPFLSPGDLPDPGIKPRSPALQADALTSEPPWPESVARSPTEGNSSTLA